MTATGAGFTAAAAFGVLKQFCELDDKKHWFQISDRDYMTDISCDRTSHKFKK